MFDKRKTQEAKDIDNLQHCSDDGFLIGIDKPTRATDKLVDCVSQHPWQPEDSKAWYLTTRGLEH